MRTAHSINSARNTLVKMFSNSDEITLQEWYSIGGRTDYSEVANKRWRDKKLADLRYFKAIDTRYETTDKKRVAKLVITDEGKRILNDSVPDGATAAKSSAFVNKTDTKVTLQEITDLVKEFEKQNPDWKLRLVPIRKGDEELQP